MPMFLVSEIWYKKWKRFVKGDAEDECPGIISHFEIMDHRYYSLWDPTSHKKYTNFHLYPSSQVKALPKKCWLKLKDIYKGVDLKRFNVWVMGKPKEVITELFLKKVKIKKDKQSQIYEFQISKK